MPPVLVPSPKKLTAGLRKELAIEFEALEKAVSFHCIGADVFIPPVNFEIATPRSSIAGTRDRIRQTLRRRLYGRWHP
jgi:hypothetical protein